MCNAGGVTIVVINSVIYTAIIVSVIWFASKSKDAVGQSKFRYYMLLIYFVCVLMQCVTWGVSDIFHCINEEVYDLMGFLGGMFMGTSYLVLLLVLFGRLVYIFEGTTCDVSKQTQRLFYGLFIAFQAGFGIFGISYMTQINNLIFITILVVLLFTLFVALIVMIFYLFSSKLIQIIKMVDSQNQSSKSAAMIHLISKTFLLSIASIVSFIFPCIAVVLQSALGKEGWVFYVSAPLSQIDIITTVLSISLGFKQFEPQYMWLCRRSHMKCIKICSKRAIGKEIDVVEMDLVQLQKEVDSTGTTGSNPE